MHSGLYTQAEEEAASSSGVQHGATYRTRTVQSGGPGWTSTTITFNDSSHPGVLTLHNLLGACARSAYGA